MSTVAGADSSAGQIAPFRIHLSAQQVVEESLDIQKPIYLLVSGLTHQYQLPPIEGGYGLFGGAERRPISRELSLLRTPYASGGDLYLASNRAPWWAGAAAVAARPAAGRRPTTQSPSVRSAASLNLKTVALAVIGVIAVGLLGLLLWPQGDDKPPRAEPTIAILPPTTVAIAPTATLLPVTPTPELTVLAAKNYQDGLAAYNLQNWPLAAALLQQVYAYDVNYQDVRQILGATLYNWGIALRDQGDITGSVEQFASAIAVDPTHPLAAGEQQKSQLYLDALSAHAGGQLRDAAIKLEELRELQADYLDSAAQLYDIYMSYGAELEAERQSEDALRIYQKAAELPLDDVSAAQAKVKALSPTPVAKRLRFSVANYNDNPSCISIRVSGIGTGGWYFTVDGIGGVVGYFDSGGNARACGLGNGQEVTLTVHSADGRGVAGGMGVPSKGSAIMVATWR